MASAPHPASVKAEPGSTPASDAATVAGSVAVPDQLRVDDVDADWINSRIMMVDDDESTLDVVSLFLEEDGYPPITTSTDSAGAVALVQREEPDLLLLDIHMPDVSGIEILAALRADTRYKHLPVIILTAASDSETKLEVLKLGATDFLAKPVDSSELLLRVRNTLAAKAHRDRLAFVDEATGLANRARFLQDAEALQRQTGGDGVAVVTVTVPHIERSVRLFQPTVQAAVLKVVARRLEATLSGVTYDLVGNRPRYLYRTSGDEFAILLSNVAVNAPIDELAEQLSQSLARPIAVNDVDISISARIGIATRTEPGDEVAQLLEYSGVAASHAAERDASYEFYSASLHAHAHGKLALRHDLRIAVENGDLELWYQPKVDAESGEVRGFEALARWWHEERGMVPPAMFIPIAEDLGLIEAIGQWVLETACRECARWRPAGPAPTVSVNVSAHQLRQAQLPRIAYGALVSSGLAPSRLTLELTESVFMDEVETALTVLESARSMGMSLSLDDFGTGFSSFSYLSQLPLDELKIDRAFVVAMAGGERNVAIVRAIIAMAHELGLKVVAEGIETSQQRALLHAAGCDQLQGFLFRKPMRAAAVRPYLASQLVPTGT